MTTTPSACPCCETRTILTAIAPIPFRDGSHHNIAICTDCATHLNVRTTTEFTLRVKANAPVVDGDDPEVDAIYDLLEARRRNRAIADFWMGDFSNGYFVFTVVL